jgi:acyl carrier protein
VNKEAIMEIVLMVIGDYLKTQDIEDNLTPETRLLGNDSILDSIGLVNIVVDLETEFLDRGFEISLTSEKAMSRTKSPFRTAMALSEFIYEQINER